MYDAVRRFVRTLADPSPWWLARRWSTSLKAAPGALAALALLPGLSLHAADHQVTANIDNTFSPAQLTIAVGDAVTWSNVGGGLHNVVADDASFRCANGCDGDGGNGNPASNDWSFTLFFPHEDLIDYFCEVHVGLGMTGSITVEGIFGDSFETGDFSAWTSVVGN